jgi:hypothetical protein
MMRVQNRNRRQFGAKTMDADEKDSLILPSAFSALAFEHVNQIAAQRIHDHSDNCEFPAATAGRVRLIFDNSNLLGAKYLHGRHGCLQPSAAGVRC